MTRFAALFIALLHVAGPGRAAEAPVTVFAAASLRGVLEEASAGYTADVRLSFGGSGTMARQVAAGAPADVIILANVAWMDWLAARGMVEPGAYVTLARNQLVLIGPPGAAPLADISDLPKRLATGRLAIGQRDAVPAGIYARQWLQSAGLWNVVSDRLAETDNVRAALALVARGEAPLGIVYATDAQAEPDVITLFAAPSDSHDPVGYPAAALTSEGEAYLSYLQTLQVQQIFATQGFLPPAPP